MKQLFIISMLILSGCASRKPITNPVTNPIINPAPITNTIIQTIQSTDWIMSILLIGCVIGIFGGLNGMKTGWIGFLSCLAGIFLKSALTNVWVYWCCGLLFAGTVLVLIVSIIWKNKVIKELILSVQYLKQHVDTEVAKNIFSLTQSNDTVATVNQIKSVMKTKGIIQ